MKSRFRTKNELTDVAAIAAIMTNMLLGGCTPGQPKNAGFEPPPGGVVAIVLSVDSIAVQPAETYAFSATGRLSDGSVVTGLPIAWQASGGTVSTKGLYTAGQASGRYHVIATQQGGTVADTSIVSISPPPVILLQLLLTPATITLAPGHVWQFAVAGSWSDGSSTVPSATYSATGGTITPTGVYTAGSEPGTFKVIATQSGDTKADTSVVTVTADTGLQPLWAADMESGDLKQWEDNTYQPTPCGGQFNSGPQAGTVPSLDFARSGRWSAKMVIGGVPTGGATNGTRMYRWCEAQRNPDLYYSVWFYIPEKLTVAPSSGWINVFQYNSKLPGHINADPFFYVEIFNTTTGAMRFRLTWWPSQSSEGPFPGQHGYRAWESPQDIPVGRWFQLQARQACTGDFSGAIEVWQDDVEIFNLTGVRTRYPDGDCQWAVNNYGTDIAPSPVVLYIDDAAIGLSKIAH